MHILWKGKVVKTQWDGNALYDSSFTIGRHNIDIAQAKDIATLVLDIKVLRQPTESTTLNMQSNNSNKCQASYQLKNVLRNIKTDQWIHLPIPLNCFSTEGEFDYSKVTTIMSIATQGKLEIELANVGIALLPEGSIGCK